METMKQSGLWSNLGTHGSLVVIWWLCISSSGVTRKFDIWSQIWPWSSSSIAPPPPPPPEKKTKKTNIKDPNQGILHLWSKFGYPSFNGGWVMVRKSSKWGKFSLLSWIWPWRSRSITPQNNTDLNQGLLHLRSKFGDPSLKWVMSYRSDKLGVDTQGHEHRQTQATTIPESQNWPRVTEHNV